MAEPDERLDQEDDAERRIARARLAIGKSFEELIARGETAAKGVEPPASTLGGSGGSGASPPHRTPPPLPDIEGSTVGRDELPAPAGPPPTDPSGQGAGNPDDIAASVERRVSAWVDGRVRAAERRLELQSEAFEAALGEEAVGSRRATEQVEKVRKSLAVAADQALNEVAAAVNDARDELNAEVRERVDTALAQAEVRVRALGTAMQDEFRSSVAEANQERVEDAVKAAAAGLQEAADRARSELRDDIANRLAEVSGEISAEVDSRVERRLGEAVKRVEADGKRTVAEATNASSAAAAAEVEGRLPMLEERIDRGAGDQRAAIEARFSAAEATLRSRLGAAIDENTTEQDRRMREEAASHRKRINEELAAALQTTAAELRRRVEADRESASREFTQAAREEISAAVERIDQLHSAAVRDARDAAEAVAATRLADAQTQIARQFENSREESKVELDRGISGVDSRLREMFEELRGAQEAAGATREEEIRRRNDVRMDELASEFSGRVEREVGRKFAEAQAHLERSNAESAGRAREEARAGVEAAVNREVAKGEARIAAAAEGVDLIVEERVAEGVAAIERRLQDQLATRQLEAQRTLERRFDALGSELSAGVASEVRESAASAAAEAQRRALADITRDVAAAVEEARRGAHEELEAAARQAASGAVSAEAASARENLVRSLERGVQSHLQAFRAEVNSGSYQDHNRRAEAAATAQLARSLDALKNQRAAAAAALAEQGSAECERVIAERTDIEAQLQRTVDEVGSDLENRASEIRIAAEKSVQERAEEALTKEFEARAAELEQRLDALATRNEQESSMRLAAAAAEVEGRLSAVDQAQQREEQIRARMSAAEREADQRVREAEQRLVEVLARIDVVER